MVKHVELYNTITDFSVKFGSVKWNNPENVEQYKKLVDLCIKYGKIPECNRKEYSTHSCLYAAICYESDRVRFCQ